MEYRKFGQTGLDVSAIGFGCWEMGGTYGQIDEAEVVGAIHAGLDLGINLFESQWTSLASQSEFLGFMNTPIIKAKKGQAEKLFYNEGQYTAWKQVGATQGWTIKYYKGLGTSTASEFKEYFKNKRIVLRANRVSCCCIFKTNTSYNISCVELIAFFTSISVHFKYAGNTLFFFFRRVE